jgi:hypothetical protein
MESEFVFLLIVRVKSNNKMYIYHHFVHYQSSYPLFKNTTFRRLDSASVFRRNLGPIERASLCLRNQGAGHQNLVSETSCLKIKKRGRQIMCRIVTVVLMYHSHKPIDSNSSWFLPIGTSTF